MQSNIAKTAHHNFYTTTVIERNGKRTFTFVTQILVQDVINIEVFGFIKTHIDLFVDPINFKVLDVILEIGINI